MLPTGGSQGALGGGSLVSSAPSFGIREKQTVSLASVMELNREPELADKDDETSMWKVLVYDNRGSDIIAPVMHVGDLRKHGITLHLPLHSDRQPVPEAPAIYFCAPTRDNIRRICSDIAAQMYQSFYLNFTSSLTQSDIDELAEKTAGSGTAHLVKQVYDQYIDFISLERDLFSMNMESSYMAFNDPQVTEKDAERDLTRVVDCLFSVCLTLGVLPVIRCQRLQAAEMIGQRLEERLRQALLSPALAEQLSATSPLAIQRPLLVLADRNLDLTSVLHHTWTYQALVADLLEFKLNRVRVPRDDGTVVWQDLDSATDATWQNLSTAIFPKVAVEVEQGLADYKAAASKVDRLKEGDATEIQISTKELGSFITTIPELRERMKKLEAHTNIAFALLEQIKARQLDNFYLLEENITVHSVMERKEIEAALAPDAKGTFEDKLRLLLIWYMSHSSAAEAQKEFEQLERQLSSIPGANMAPLAFVRKMKAFNEGVASVQKKEPQGGLSKYSSMFSTIVQTGVRFLQPQAKLLYLTRIVDALMDAKPAAVLPQVTENFLYLDPKLPPRVKPQQSLPFKEAIVFTVGGGSYFEYHNIQEYAKQSGKRIIYGTTEMLTAHGFLKQLTELHNKSNAK